MSKVTLMIDHKSDARLWSPEQMFQDALDELANGERTAKKAMILWLDDEDGEYRVGYSQSGMTRPECVLLCEIGKDRFKMEMFD